MNCLLNALAMSLGLMCVLTLKVIELLSCCGGRLCASPCMVFQKQTYNIAYSTSQIYHTQSSPEM